MTGGTGNETGAESPVVVVANRLPVDQVTDADGTTVSLADYRGKRVVVYFYPAAATPGCTKQACDFSDSLEALRAADTETVRELAAEQRSRARITTGSSPA